VHDFHPENPNTLRFAGRPIRAHIIVLFMGLAA
jgi:hypothetical protein